MKKLKLTTALDIALLSCFTIGGWGVADHYAKKEIRGKIEACFAIPDSKPETQIECIKKVSEEIKPRSNWP